jgi:hypothetical protein
MTFKHLLFSFSLLATFSLTDAQAAKKNDCDLFEENLEMNKATMTPAAIQEELEIIRQCRAKPGGESAYYKEKLKNQQKNEEKEIKEKINYSRGMVKNKKVVTTPQDLCVFLGYSKAVDAGIGADEIGPTEAYLKSYTLKEKVFGSDIEAKLNDDKGIDYAIQIYTSLTCVKSKNDDIQGAKDLKKVVEYVIDANNPPIKLDDYRKKLKLMV